MGAHLPELGTISRQIEVIEIHSARGVLPMLRPTVTSIR